MRIEHLDISLDAGVEDLRVLARGAGSRALANLGIQDMGLAGRVCYAAGALDRERVGECHPRVGVGRRAIPVVAYLIGGADYVGETDRDNAIPGCGGAAIQRWCGADAAAAQARELLVANGRATAVESLEDG